MMENIQISIFIKEESDPNQSNYYIFIFLLRGGGGERATFF